MAVAYENARRHLGLRMVWEYTESETSKVAMMATLVKVTVSPSGEGKLISLRLKSEDPDEPFVDWNAANARPIQASTEE